MKPCIIEGCDRFTTPKTGRGMCKSHYDKFARYGDPEYKPIHVPISNPKYSTVHKRLVKEHGAASQYKCNCGSPATDWACIDKDATEVIRGYSIGYSHDIQNYKPMCKSCHVAYDKPQPPELCMRGHNDWYYYQNKNKRYCRSCSNEIRRARGSHV